MGNRVERLEQRAGLTSGEACGLCAQAEAGGDLAPLDDTVWQETEQMVINTVCPGCGGPRRIVYVTVERREPGAA